MFSDVASLVLGNVLVLTIVVILALATLGAILRSRRKDVCLKSFSGYLVYVRMKSGKQVWGRLRTESTGIELKYRADHFDADGHIESSFIIFKGEFPGIYVMLRFADELTERTSKRRAKTLRQSYRPNLFRKTRRKVRNWFNLVRDAIGESLSAAISAATKTMPMAGQQGRIGKSSTDVVEWFGNAYDPILEHHIGRRVVVEVTAPDGKSYEHVGVFREYSADYLEVIDVDLKEDDRVRRVDMIVPRAHGHIRHGSEPVRRRNSESDEKAPALLADPSEPETVAQQADGSHAPIPRA